MAHDFLSTWNPLVHWELINVHLNSPYLRLSNELGPMLWEHKRSCGAMVLCALGAAWNVHRRGWKAGLETLSNGMHGRYRHPIAGSGPMLSLQHDPGLVASASHYMSSPMHQALTAWPQPHFPQFQQHALGTGQYYPPVPYGHFSPSPCVSPYVYGHNMPALTNFAAHQAGTAPASSQEHQHFVGPSLLQLTN